MDEKEINDEIKSLRHNVSEMQKSINRIRMKADEFRQINDDRKEQLTRISIFMDKLLAEGRVSRAELKAIFPKRRRSPTKEWKW
jgi:SMC interacting uncharacterized protein involved in chromosome segregation